jgi:uncharacterized protein
MLAHIAALIAACLCAVVLGFVAHRANICTVRAVAELLSARTAYMLASTGKAILWAGLLIVPLVWLAPSAIAGISGWELTSTALIGGFLFGLGSSLNGGCAFSTMTRMMDGEVRMALSIAGFAIGIFAFISLADARWLAHPKPAHAMIGSLAPFALIAVLLLVGFAAYELPRLWRNRPKHVPLHRLALAPQYELSAAAIVIAIASAGIFLLVGAPGYTITLQNFVQSTVGTSMLPSPLQGAMMLALLAGMLVSALQRRSFRLDWRPQPSWLRNVLAGALMGLGTGMLPGGNDALLLSGLPSFSPHAPLSYVTLLIGAGIGVLAMKLAGGNTNVSCKGDMYCNKSQPAGSILTGHQPLGSA